MSKKPRQMTKSYRLDRLFGYVKLTIPPFAYGEQPPPAIYEDFDGDGRLRERRECPPVIRVIY